MKPSPAVTLPSVEKLLQSLGPLHVPRPLVVELVRDHLSRLRAAGEIPSFEIVLESVRARMANLGSSRLQPVINGTGILVHTNLGRSPLGAPAVEALRQIAGAYSNLEMNLETGDRGNRAAYIEQGLALLCHAGAATVVNNGAAALVLILRHFTAGPRKEVIISRGELVQIGGGFRIPDILETSGCRLREVGTTNQTDLDDYERAIGDDTALVLKVHRSNFNMEGFVSSPTIAALAAVSHRHALPLVEDLGSGALVDLTACAPVEPEPRPQESLEAGADLVCFSGDKLLGGPQAGIIVGREELVAAIKRDPFFRALRCDKLVFAALQATVESYLLAASRKDLGPPIDVPVLSLLGLSEGPLWDRATRIAAALAGTSLEVEAGPGRSEIGGGVSPRSVIPSVTIRVRTPAFSVDEMARRLRLGPIPVVGFVRDGWLQLDLRTVFSDQDDTVIEALRRAAGVGHAAGAAPAPST